MSPIDINKTLLAAKREPVDAATAEAMSRHFVAQTGRGERISDGIDPWSGEASRDFHGHMLSLAAALREIANPALILNRMGAEIESEREALAAAERERDYRVRCHARAVDLKMHEIEIEHRRRDLAGKEGVVEWRRARIAELTADLEAARQTLLCAA